MKFHRALLLSGVAGLSCFGFSPALAQDQTGVAESPDPELLNEEEQIIVLAERLHGQVEAPQPPLQVLDEEDIAAYGAGSLAELLQELTPQTTSGRGRGGGFPALLVNGMRVSSFREIRSYPPEAIRTIEILPEEVALRYGYSADQRVINIILKDDYSSFELEREYGQPWAGGYWQGELEATFLKIDGSNRLNLNADVNHSSSLTELERDIVEPDTLIPTVAGDPDPAAERTLVDRETSYGFDATYTMAVGDSGGSLALNASVEKSDRKGRDGYNIVLLTDPASNTERRVVNPDDVINRKSETLTVSSGATLNHPLGDWQLTATLDGSIAHSKNYNDRLLDMSGLVAGALAGDFPIDGVLPVLPPAERDLAETTSRNFNSLATATGTLLWLPAGDVSATLRAGYNITDYESSDTRNPGVETSLRRNALTAGANLGIPLTSRRDDVLAAIGDVSLNFSGGISDLSDFGTLYEYTAGITWAPTESLYLQASYIYNEAAPGLTQLGSPTIVSQNVAFYDFANNETVLIETTSGGNPGLSRETRKDIRLAAQWSLPFFPDASLQVEYFHNRSFDIASSFPSILTPDIEAAFADRVTRDIDGTLLALDLRPVTFERQVSKRIRWGINFGGELGGGRQEAQPQQAGQGGGAPAASPVGPNGPQFGGAPGGPPQGGQAPRGAFNPEAFQTLRAQLCGDGESDTDGELSPEILEAMPEPLRARLTGPDGQLDPERVKEFKSRICSANGPPFGQGQPPQGEGASGEQPQDGAPPQGGFRFRGPPPGAPGAGGPPPGAGGPPGGGGGPPIGLIMRRAGGGGGGGRFFVNLFHTIELENQLVIAEGLPVLDLLDGDALSGGGTVRHSVELEGGMFYQGKGLRLSGRYSGPSRVDGSGLPGSSDLHFGSLATLDLRMFVDLGQQEKLVEKHPFFKGSRISFSIDNIFDSYRKVTDDTGEIPLRYQRGLIDPVGRYFEIEFRKLF